MHELLLVAGAFVVAMAGVIIATRLSGSAARRKARRRALMLVPETPIAGVKNGEIVRITGRAVAREPLRTSPISQRACIGFRLIVYRLTGGEGPIPGGRDNWQEPVYDREGFDSFLLADGTGEAILHAPFEIDLDPYDARSENTLALLELLHRDGVAIRGLFGVQHQFRYVETVLLPGDEITAVGRATIEIDPAGRSPSPRDPPVICHLKGADEPVVIADADDGLDAIS